MSTCVVFLSSSVMLLWCVQLFCVCRVCALLFLLCLSCTDNMACVCVLLSVWVLHMSLKIISLAFGVMLFKMEICESVGVV